MVSCVFRKCCNHGSKIGKTSGITYHTFPTDAVRLLEWIAVVRRQRAESDWIPTKTSRICIKHFKDSDVYSTKTGKTFLKKDAIPILGEEYNHLHIEGTPTCHDRVIISDIEEILDKPRKAGLKIRVRKLEFQKKQLQKQNEMLKKQNQILKKKISSISFILKKLKRRMILQTNSNLTPLFSDRSD